MNSCKLLIERSKAFRKLLICFNANFKVEQHRGLKLPVLKPRFRTWQPQSRIAKGRLLLTRMHWTYFLAEILARSSAALRWPINTTRRTCPRDCLQRYWNGGLICAKQNRT